MNIPDHIANDPILQQIDAVQDRQRFKPRPDQPERHDQQTAFYNCDTRGISWMIGGNGAGTTEVALAKLAKFVLQDQAPPRFDTEFWIAANSYEMAMGVNFTEKLLGNNHIPESQIDWDRVSWYRPNNLWPFRVPLKPWPGQPGKNWTLVFKSYEQGRMHFQAKSIGGFMFSEQFPWELLVEVLRGCRDHNFPGSKFCEFTPVDPNLSIRLEIMLEDDTIPDGWEFYRANTECALEAGHVERHWFDEFFGTVPTEMRDTRMTGQFATYEGQIYTGFNPAIHVVGDDVVDFPPGVYHRRAIDWGSGPENAMVCLWAYRNGVGCYHIYDEYYSNEPVTILQHLDEIVARHPWPESNPHFGTTYADPSGKAFIRLATREYRIPITGAANAVLDGIDTIRTALQINPTIGEPMLFIHNRCKNLIRELRTYRWKKSSGRGTNPQDARIEPLKKSDHAVDALRYLLHSERFHTGIVPTSEKREFNPHKYGVMIPHDGRRWRDIWRHGIREPERN